MINAHCGIDLPAIDGRMPILVTDWDKAAYIHFLAMAPAGMSLPDAKRAITEAFSAARREDEDTWSYEDVREILAAAGFVCHDVAVWEENSDGYPPAPATTERTPPDARPIPQT